MNYSIDEHFVAPRNLADYINEENTKQYQQKIVRTNEIEKFRAGWISASNVVSHGALIKQEKELQTIKKMEKEINIESRRKKLLDLYTEENYNYAKKLKEKGLRYVF